MQHGSSNCSFTPRSGTLNIEAAPKTTPFPPLRVPLKKANNFHLVGGTKQLDSPGRLSTDVDNVSALSHH